MKKRIIAICLVIALAAVAIVGGTMAYLTDTDAKANVMTIGNVDIIQNEQDRYGNVFVDGQKMYPMVNKITEGGIVVDGWFNEGLRNEIDKVVTVTNNGSEAAYIRTIIAFETKITYQEGSDVMDANLHDEYFLINGTYEYLYLDEAKTLPMVITINDTEYWLAVCTYQDIIQPGHTTTPSLRQFGLSWDVDNAHLEWFGSNYNILCLSQACQAAGFDNAEDALNTAFGQITAQKAAEWFASLAPNN